MKPFTLLMAAAVCCFALMTEPALATVFRLSASNIDFGSGFGPNFPPFTTDTISGTITLSDSITPGQQFSSANVTALSLDFFGLQGTLADIEAETSGPVQLYGTLTGAAFRSSILALATECRQSIQ